MNPLGALIPMIVVGVVLGEALKAFRIDFVDLIVFTAFWIVLPIFVLDKIAPKSTNEWIQRRSESEAAALLLVPPLVGAVIGWYLVNWNYGPFARMNGLTAFCVLYYLAFPFGVAFVTFLGPELFKDDGAAETPDITVLPPARPMAPADYGGNVIDFSAAKQAADTGDFDFDPARFGKSGGLAAPLPAPVPPPERIPLIAAPVDQPSRGRLIVDMGFSRVYELGADSFLVVTEGKRDTIMNRRKFTAKTGCCIDDLRGHWSFGRDANAVKKKSAERAARARR